VSQASSAKPSAIAPPREPWIIRTYAGFGDARQANARFLTNLRAGQRGLSIAFDLPTQNGYDPDAALAAGEVGRAGVSVCQLEDMEALLAGIDPGAVNISMTINATAPFIFALYLVLAERRGVAWDALRGTTQNDLFKEFVARGTSIFEPELSLRLSADLIAFAAERVPNWNPINCCGYHYMESGAGPAEEIGYTFANALMVLDALRPRLDRAAFERVVRRVSFFINSGLELVPEICKVRAYFKLWPELCRRQYGIEDVRFRAGCQVRSLTLTEQQPEVNIIRIAYEALPVVLSAGARVNALQLPGFREAIGLPDQAEQLLALRTQQVLMYETELTRYDDIFEGSRVIERLTAETAAEAEAIALRLRALGYARAIAAASAELTQRLADYQRKLDSGETIRVGVNAFAGEIGLAPPPRLQESGDQGLGALERERVEAVRLWRARHNQAAVAAAREKLARAVAEGGSVTEPTLGMARAGATVGEWTETVAQAGRGRYTPPIAEQAPGIPPLGTARVNRPVRVALGKAGLDGHMNAVKLLAHALRQAGMEVILTGFRQTPAQMVEAALQEDAELLAISTLAGAHLEIAEQVMAALGARGASGVKVVMGGIIPEPDRGKLLSIGVAAVFTPSDSNLARVVEKIVALLN
jgi:(2R)-ethylmalonyl-CoA mutase